MQQKSSKKYNYRYPGVTPFTADQSDIFFGRKDDIKELCRLVRREKLVVLYGKSGLGKSSLINAGVLPALKEEYNYSPLIIRFGAWTERNTDTPLEKTKQIVAQNFADSTFLDSLIPQENSLWYYLKTRRINEKKKPILVFDQFEELFSYPENEILEFQQELAEVLNTNIPLRFLRVLDNHDNLSEQEEEQLDAETDGRIIFAIRSDRMHLMDRLKKYLPTVLRHNYELKALKKEDARDAIVMPAQSTGKFRTIPFKFNNDAIEDLLTYLQDDDDKEGRIEGILLQMLCEYYERHLVEEKNLQTLTNKDIGDPEQVVKQYYNEKVNGLNSTDKIPAKTLIEEGLISEGEAMRLTLHESFIKDKYDVSDELLNKLVELRLLRSEPFIRGGYTYELSHDRLVGPVVNSRSQSRAAQAILDAEEQKKALTKAKKRAEEEVKLRQKAEASAKVARQQTRFANFISAVAVVCALFAAFSYRNAKQAEITAAKAKTEALANLKIAEKAEAEAKASLETAQLAEKEAIKAKEIAENEKLKTKEANDRNIKMEEDAKKKREKTDFIKELTKVERLFKANVCPPDNKLRLIHKNQSTYKDDQKLTQRINQIIKKTKNCN